VVVLDQAEEVIRYTLNPLPDLLGPRFKGDFPALRKLLVEDESGGYARTLLGGEPIEVTFKGEAVALTPEEVEVRSSPVEGYAAAQDAAYLAAVKIALSDDLVAEGLAREFIRRVQTLRKEADFNIDDRIVTAYAASERLAKAVEQFAGLIKGETLSDVLVASDDQKGERSESYEFDGETLRLAISRK
jgi:isoleucyl-tRNA synthetase